MAHSRLEKLEVPPSDSLLQVFHGTNNAGAIPLLPVTLRSHACNFSNVPATLGAIREAHLDVIVDPTSWPRLTALYCILSGAMTVGFHSDGQLRHYGFDIAVAPLLSRHEVENCAPWSRSSRPIPTIVCRCEAIPPNLPYACPTRGWSYVTSGQEGRAPRKRPGRSGTGPNSRLGLVADGFVVGFTGTKADVPLVASVLAAAALPAEGPFRCAVNCHWSISRAC